MFGGFANAGDGCSQVVKRATAARTANVFGLGGAQSGSLQYAKGRGIHVFVGQVAVVHQPNAIRKPVYHQRTHVGSGFQLECFFLFGCVSVHLREYNGVVDACRPQLVNQRTLIANLVLVCAHAHHHHFGVMFKASQIFVAVGSILQHEELNICLNKRDKGHGIMWEDGINLLAGLRIGAGQLHVGIVVHDVTTLCREVCGQMSTYIYVIGRLVGVGHHVNLILIRAVAYHYG